MNVALNRSLIDLLITAGVPTYEEATQLATTLDGVSWTTQVLDSGKVDENRFLQAIGDFFQVPVVSIDAKSIDRQTLSLLPSRLVFQHHILPIEVRENAIVLATYDLFNSVGRQLASQLLKKPAEWVLVPRGQILRAMKSLYGVGAETFDEILKTNRSYEADQDIEGATDLNADDPEASVVKFVNQIIREAIVERATDIHVEPLEDDLRIRYRIDGILHEVAVPPQLRLLQSAIISRLKVMAHMDIAERRLPQDGRINLQSNSANIDVRVSTIPTVNGESISLRLLSRDQQHQQFGFERLDLSAGHSRTVEALLQQPNGIVLVTGPTGSGKSTSLYCFLSSINSVQRRIITIEEPVEYRLPGVSQIDVKPEIDLTFAKGLRHILRQDPNVIMVGEIRDFETAEIAIRAAMTGHLVFSTLHTNDAVGGITRLLDMGVEQFLLASTVRAFLAQRLVRTICPDCSQLVDYPREYLAEIGFPLELGTRFMRGVGCDNCRQTGYQGRLAIYEICVITEAMRRLIVQKRDGGELKQAAVSQGMETLRQDGWRRVAQGKTTVEEVVRVTQNDEVMSETTVESAPATETEAALV
ncbi:MAG: Type IV fimbrial assembly, ATPase PilB [uncultured Chthoniobacterales bacterium]|uniref:Type IV fimbrial assembly, ATPase PilB n=1 Tax=uncultured Chthoniobacterales bacterium TaxID=1836801 RepID=A0A6J4ILE3_9BACT|nr:MAG: Type IV fimbrial assembly, ATPase PilB [uncultured Chthoniobacterales bacterium]